jgi:hypothetical protein
MSETGSPNASAQIRFVPSDDFAMDLFSRKCLLKWQVHRDPAIITRSRRDPDGSRTKVREAYVNWSSRPESNRF